MADPRPAPDDVRSPAPSLAPSRAPAPSAVPAGTSRPEPTGWLDLARVLAIGAVVMVHESGAALGRRGPGVPATWAWLVADVLDAASRWCVPVFVMVSGALLLDPRRADSPREFYRRRLARIGLPLVVWTAVYLAFGHWYLERPVGVVDVLRAVGTGSPFLQLYFLYAIAGLYLLAPFLRAALAGTSPRAHVGLAAILLGIGVLDRVITDLLGIGGPNAATRWLAYAGYFVAGWVLRSADLTPGRTRLAAVLLPVSIVVTAAAAVVMASGGRGWGKLGEYVISYVSPSVVMMSLAAFWLIRAVGNRPAPAWRPGRRTRALSDLTFGIFLVHALIWYPLVQHWQVPSRPVAYLATALWHWTVVIAASTAITLVLQRAPGLRRLV